MGLIKHLQEAAKYLGSYNPLGQLAMHALLCSLLFTVGPFGFRIHCHYVCLPPVNSLVIPEGQGRIFPCFPQFPTLALALPPASQVSVHSWQKLWLVLQLWVWLSHLMNSLRAVTVVFISVISPAAPKHRALHGAPTQHISNLLTTVLQHKE